MNLAWAVASLHLLTGLGYLVAVGGYPAVDIYWHRRSGHPLTRPEEVFGLCLIGMALTCGPHHLHLAEHVARTGRTGWYALVALVVGFPAALTWTYLRTETFWGGKGDHAFRRRGFIIGMAAGLLAVYLAGGLTLLIASSSFTNPGLPVVQAAVQAILVVLYFYIGYALWSTQYRRYSEKGEWSLAGLALAFIFPTCALSHASMGYYVANGTYEVTWHFLVIDGLGIVAAAVFCVVLATRRRREPVIFT